jgi:hypothetical protein
MASQNNASALHPHTESGQNDAQALRPQDDESGRRDTLEKDFSNHPNGGGYGYTNGSDTYHLNDTSMDSEAALRRIRTAGSISISPELFEKIYLSPQNTVKGDLRKTFGNPTPL